MNLRRVLAWLVAFLVLCGRPYCEAQSPLGGGKIVRVYDGVASRRITDRDRLTIGIARVIIQKSRGLFKQDEQAGLQVTTRINGEDGQANQQAATINRVYVVKVKDFSTGSISLPLEGVLVNRFPLSNAGYTFSSMDLSIYLLKKRGNTGFGSVVTRLAALTQTTAFPSLPFSDGIKQLGQLTTDLLSDDNNAANGIDQRVAAATVSLLFSPEGKDVPLFVDSTGTFAVIYGPQEQGEGLVDIARENGYCFKYSDAGGSRALLQATKDAAGKCGSYGEIRNDHLLFFVGAFQPQTAASKATSTQYILPNEAVDKPPSLAAGDVAGVIERLKIKPHQEKLFLDALASDPAVSVQSVRPASWGMLSYGVWALTRPRPSTPLHSLNV